MPLEVFVLEFMFIIVFDSQRWGCDLSMTLSLLKLHDVYGWKHTHGSSSSITLF